MEREFYGDGGRLTLTENGVLYGAGWNLSFPYSVDYSEEEAKAAAPVKIADNVIGAAAGFNYAVYVTDDGKLHFVGDSGIPYKERFSFDGIICEVSAEPDRDVFYLTDENGDSYVFGDNTDGSVVLLEKKIHAVFDNQVVTLRNGDLVWIYKKDDKECRKIGTLINYFNSEKRGILKRNISRTKVYREIAREYGEDNIEMKYVLRSKSEKRRVRSEDWTDDLRSLKLLNGFIPYGSGITDIRRGPYNGIERDYVYSVGLFTVNYYLYKPVKLGESTLQEVNLD